MTVYTMDYPLVLLHSTLDELDSKDLKKFRFYLILGTLKDFPRIPKGNLPEDSDTTDIAYQMTKLYGVEGSLKISLHILGQIKNNDLATKLKGKLKTLTDRQLSSGLDVSTCDKANEYDELLLNLKTAIQADLKRRFKNISEGVSEGRSVLLNDVFVELYITEGGTGDINDQHEVRQIEVTRQINKNRDTQIKCIDLFKTLPEQKGQITSVLTKGIAGIGKTVSVQKFILDWVDQKANDDIAVIVSLPFRDLNRKRRIYSLTDLLHNYAPQLKEVKNLEKIANKMLLILDGLDECRHDLNFHDCPWWSDISRPTTVGVLLTNLINGNLLSSARIWITSRPAAASQIPPECIHRLTEVRGFGDSQKEEYFRKRMKDDDKANTIITHMKASRTLYIMCHIPIFCWISATVFENMFDDSKAAELPQTLTEMYIDFLIVQTCMKNRKYNGANLKTSKTLSNSDKEMILKLGQLAFSQLSKGNLIFYEDDLKDCGIDVSKASEYSSLCTEIFREEKGLYSERVFCFVHLTIQEFLAAVYVHVSCVQKNKDVLILHNQNHNNVSLSDIHRKAVEIALQSPKGKLDLFLRFLLGLCREDKQTFLQDPSTTRLGVLQKIKSIFITPDSSSKISTTLCVEKTINFIKNKICEVKAAERTINLLHCLSELKDNSLVTDILNDVVSGKLSDNAIQPDKCAALTFAVLMSGEVLDVFDLKKFKTSAAGQQRLLCMMKACRQGRLASCNITAESCEIVASALQLENSPLVELELSKNQIGDEGVKYVCTGLKSSHCSLAKLRMDECCLSAESCQLLALALQSENVPLRELDLSYNNIGDEGVKFFCTGLISSHCKIEKLSLVKCGLTEDACGHVASAIKVHCTLTDLQLSHNCVTDFGMEMVCDALLSAHCKLSSLGVAACDLTSEFCKSVTKIIQSETSNLSELDLNYNDLRDVGVKLLCDGLMNANSKIKVLKLSECSLTEDSCEYLAYVLQSPTSKLISLKLRDNDLNDTGVKLLSAGLQHVNCRLKSLGLAGCGITDEGVFSLAFALDCNPSHLEELYLNFNNLGVRGINSLSEQRSDPKYKLEILITPLSEEILLDLGPKKYFYPFTLNNKEENQKILLCNEDRGISIGTTRDSSEYEFILCKQALRKQCYWEMEVSGDRVEIGIFKQTKGITHNLFPRLVIYQNKLYGFLQEGKIVAGCPELDCPLTLGLYLSKRAESLSFYSVCEGNLTLLGRFYSTEFCKITSAGRLVAAFKLYSNSRLQLCTMNDLPKV